MTKTERIEKYKREYLNRRHKEYLQNCFPAVGEVKDFEPLEGGMDNINVLLREKNGMGAFVVRHYIVSSPEKVKGELEFVKLLAGNGFPTPNPIETGNGELFLRQGEEPSIAIFPFVDGVHEYTWTKAQHIEAGGILAWMHNICENNNYRIGILKKRSQILQQGIMTIAESHLKDKNRLIGEVNRFLGEDYAQHEALLNSLPAGPIHHDLNHGNVFWGEDKKIKAVIDFDECHDALYVMDIMAAFHYLALDEEKKLIPQICLDLIEGYRKVRELYRKEIEIMPVCWDLLNLTGAVEFLTEFKKELKSVMECRNFKEIYLRNRNTVRRIIQGLL